LESVRLGLSYAKQNVVTTLPGERAVRMRRSDTDSVHPATLSNRSLLRYRKVLQSCKPL